jgi:hypothetical protein
MKSERLQDLVLLSAEKLMLDAVDLDLVINRFADRARVCRYELADLLLFWCIRLAYVFCFQDYLLYKLHLIWLCMVAYENGLVSWRH